VEHTLAVEPAAKKLVVGIKNERSNWRRATVDNDQMLFALHFRSCFTQYLMEAKENKSAPSLSLALMADYVIDNSLSPIWGMLFVISCPRQESIT
jgi:hypothetical protein